MTSNLSSESTHKKTGHHESGGSHQSGQISAGNRGQLPVKLAGQKENEVVSPHPGSSLLPTSSVPSSAVRTYDWSAFRPQQTRNTFVPERASPIPRRGPLSNSRRIRAQRREENYRNKQSTDPFSSSSPDLSCPSCKCWPCACRQVRRVPTPDTDDEHYYSPLDDDIKLPSATVSSSISSSSSSSSSTFVAEIHSSVSYNPPELTPRSEAFETIPATTVVAAKPPEKVAIMKAHQKIEPLKPTTTVLVYDENGNSSSLHFDPSVAGAVAATVLGKSRHGTEAPRTFALAMAKSASLHQGKTTADHKTLHESILGAAVAGLEMGLESEIRAKRRWLFVQQTKGKELELAAAKQGTTWFYRWVSGPIRRSFSWVASHCGRAFETRAERVKTAAALSISGIVAFLFFRRLCAKFKPRITKTTAIVPFLTVAALLATRWGLRKGPKLPEPDNGLADFVSEVFNATGESYLAPAGMAHTALKIAKVELDVDTSATNKDWKLGSLEAPKSCDIQHCVLAPTVACLPNVPLHSEANSFLGITSRLFGHTIVANPNSLTAFSSFLTKTLQERLSTLIGAEKCWIHAYATMKQYGNPHSDVYDEWNSAERVGKTVQFLHNDALAEGQRIGISDSETITAFVKEEPYFPLGGRGIKAIAPRMIQNTSQQHHVSIGPTCYALSKLTSHHWNPSTPFVYASGHNQETLAACMDGYDAYYVGDVSRFDRGIHHETLRALNSWKTSSGHLSHDAVRVFTSQLKTKGVTMKGRHQYRLIGQRRSGDDNTSIDNTILNIVAHLWAMCCSTNKTVDDIAAVCRFVALGDDIVICGPSFLRDIDFAKHLEGIGWEVKPLTVPSFLDVGFCSRVIYPAASGPSLDSHVFATPPGRFFVRFPFVWNPNAIVDFGAKAYGSYLDNSCVPFVRVYLERLMAIYPGRAWNRAEWAWAPGILPQATKATWSVFTQRYGLTAADEESFREWLEDYRGGPAVANHPHILQMLEVEGLI